MHLTKSLVFKYRFQSPAQLCPSFSNLIFYLSSSSSCCTKQRFSFFFLNVPYFSLPPGLCTCNHLAWNVLYPTLVINWPFTSFRAKIKYHFYRECLFHYSRQRTQPPIICNCFFTTDATLSASLL